MKIIVNVLIISLILVLHSNIYANSGESKNIQSCLRQILSNLLIITKPKVGLTVYKDKSFNLRIVGKTLKKSKFSPEYLKKRAINDVKEFTHSFEELGFTVRPFL